MVPKSDVDPAYHAVLKEHVDNFRAHLAGRHGSDLPSPSYFPPHAFWSSAEKNNFFRALAVHSRLRPDMIARDVKTKTMPDVCVYLAMLEQGMKDLLKDTSDEEDYRSDLPIASEVSEEWLAFEERMADTLAIVDQSAVLREREEEIRLRKKTIRAPWGDARTARQGRDRDGEKERREEFNHWLEQKTSEWEREDALLSLDRAGMATLDRMIREDEERREMADGSRDAVEVSGPERAVENADHRADITNPGTDDQFIDPVLLNISRAASSSPSRYASEEANGSAIPHGVPATPLLPVHSGQSTEFSAPTYHPSSFQPSTPPFAPALLPALPIHLPEASFSHVPAPLGRGEGTFAGDDPSQMSPASRRRYQKRLHMRRKRAQATGTVANEGTGRLKPGRKPKQRMPTAQPSATPEADVHAQTTEASSPMATETPEGSLMRVDDACDDRKADRHPPKVSGLTLPYKRHAEFMSKGVNPQHLHDAGLDFFHLQAVSRLLQTYNQLHEVSTDVGSEISAEMLTLLRSVVVTFLAEVMSRAIVWKEQERIAKLQTKVWRLKENQNISAANVKHALALYGADSLDKRGHFATFIDEFGLGKNDGDEDDEDEETREHEVEEDDDPLAQGQVDVEANEEQDSEGEDTSSLPPPSLLRLIFPPFVNSPSTTISTDMNNDALELDPSIYMPWPSSSLLSNDNEPPDDEDLLPDTIDERSLIWELLEEEELDRHDQSRAVEEEQALWAKVNQNSTRASAAADTIPDVEPGPSRTVERPHKRKRMGERGSRKKGTDSGSGEERDAEDFLRGAEMDADAAAEGSEPPLRRGKPTMAKGDPNIGAGGSRPPRKKDVVRPSQWQLLYREPDPHSRIKSKVYVSDSD